MIGKRYLVSKPSGEWGEPLRLRPALRLIRDRLVEAIVDAWRIGVKVKEQGDASLVWRPAIAGSDAEAVAALRRLMRRRNNVGDLYAVEGAGQAVAMVRVRVVSKPRKVIRLDGTPALRRHHREIVRAGFKVVSWGRRACRTIASSSVPSQHAAMPEPNAEDWHGTPTEMSRLVHWSLNRANDLDLEHVIYDGKVWSRSANFKPQPYSGSCPHREHAHFDYHPSRTDFCVG